MKTYRLALIGFGNVGQGFAQILRDRGEDLSGRYGCQFDIVAVSDLHKGSIYQPSGLAPAALLEAVERHGNVSEVAAAERGWDAQRTIADSNADVVLELSYTDLRTGEPGLTHARAALEAGKHVITTNKGPVALHFPELLALARSRGVRIGVEGTVMSGTPALHLGTELLAGAGVRRIQGILNGTTNYILTQMGEGKSYQEALAEAQAKGYAEADPTGDVEGYDAAGKVVILANLVMNEPLTMADVSRRGISHLTSADIDEAAQAGEVWKLLGRVERNDHGVEGQSVEGHGVEGQGAKGLGPNGQAVKAVVEPVRLEKTHPLATIEGATNAISYATDLLGDVTLVGPGAGRLETGYALVQDLLAIHRGHGEG